MRGAVIRRMLIAAVVPVMAGCGGTAPTEPTRRMAIPEPDSPSLRERQPERPDPKTSLPVVTFTADDYASQTADDRAKYRFLKEHHQQLVEVGGECRRSRRTGTGRRWCAC